MNFQKSGDACTKITTNWLSDDLVWFQVRNEVMPLLCNLMLLTASKWEIFTDSPQTTSHKLEWAFKTFIYDTKHYNRESIISTQDRLRVKGKIHFTVLHFLASHKYWIFYRLKVCGNPTSSKSIRTIFPTAFDHFVSHSGNSHSISNFLFLIIVGCFGHHELCPCKTVNLICNMCSECSRCGPFPHLPPSSQASLISETQKHWN